MPWMQLTITTLGTQADMISEALTDMGAVSVTLQDTHDIPVYEPLPGETPLWADTDVIGLFGIGTDMHALLDQLWEQQLLDRHVQYQIDTLADQPWERRWLDDFRPMRFGKRLWICPSEYPVPDASAVNVMLDPGLAFGTGTHPTTALCLRWLDQLDLTGKTVIDFGCGSGILAIAALKLGASSAVGLDIDPQAISASRDNAIKNAVAAKLHLYLVDQAPKSLSADVVVANILAGPLCQLSAAISAMLPSGGRICLSGILSTQAEAVCRHYQTLFMLDKPSEQDEWCCIQGRKK